MADTGTGIVRRWIVWSAVTTATIFVPGGLPGSATRSPGWPAATRWAHRVGAGVSLAIIIYLGYCATGDLFDRSWPLAWQLPWMGERLWWVEILGGLTGAMVVPSALSLLWGRFRVAGAIAGTTLAVLLHVSVALAMVSLTYVLVERVSRRAPALARAAAFAAGFVALAGFAWFTLTTPR